jgi:hypothetical protein
MTKRTTERAVPAESGIIRYFSPGRYLSAPLHPSLHALDTLHLHKNDAFVTFMNDTLPSM